MKFQRIAYSSSLKAKNVTQDWIVHHDIDPSKAMLVAAEVFTNFNIAILPQVQYNLDLTSRDL